jgi:hypothetical protein
MNSSGAVHPPRSRPSPHFSPTFYCGGTETHVYCVALRRAPRHTVEYACGGLGRAPCIHGLLHRLATNAGEKCGLDILVETIQGINKIKGGRKSMSTKRLLNITLALALLFTVLLSASASAAYYQQHQSNPAMIETLEEAHANKLR